MRFYTSTVLQFLLLIHTAVIADDNIPQTLAPAAWKCAYCDFETGITTVLNGGLGYISDDSYKFGEYTGLQRKGVFAIYDVSSRFRNKSNANYWDIDALNLGLETRSMELRGGKQGKFEVSLSYNELLHLLSDSTRTPFIGNGSDTLSLPANWITGASTNDMTTLRSNLIDVNLQTKRNQFGVGAMFIPAPKWQTSLNYRHEIREGKRRIGGSFYFNSAQLVQPVDYTTDQVDAVASYSSKFWQAKLSYHGSSFSNQVESLSWHNPYLPIVSGADQGELALPPDNQFHQVLASFGVRISTSSTAMADIAIGRLVQNENYLSATTNTNLTLSPLPVESLEGRVDSVNANIKWNADVGKKFKVNANYKYDDRDNKTPQNSYVWVTTDANVAAPRTNVPYSYSRNSLRLNGVYDPLKSLRATVGYDYQKYTRTFQEVEDSKTQTLNATVVAHAMDRVDLTLKVARSARKKDGYQVISGIDSPENPLLRKYNMSDRNRSTLGARVDVAVTERSMFAANVDWAHDDYPDSVLGLTSSQVVNVDIDFSTQVLENSTFTVFLGNDGISSSVSGSQLFDISDWSGDIDDRFNTAGIGLNHRMMKNKLDMGIDYVFSQSKGKISIINSGIKTDLPDLNTKLNSIKVYANYKLSETMVLNGTYWHENYSFSDWALDDVYEDTVAKNLGLGQQTPSYSMHVFILSMRYKF